MSVFTHDNVTQKGLHIYTNTSRIKARYINTLVYHLQTKTLYKSISQGKTMENKLNRNKALFTANKLNETGSTFQLRLVQCSFVACQHLRCKLHHTDSLQTCRRVCCTTNPQQIEASGVMDLSRQQVLFFSLSLMAIPSGYTVDTANS